MITQFRTFIFNKQVAALMLSLLLFQPTWAQSSLNQSMVFEGSLTDNSGNAVNLQNQQLFYYVTALDNSFQKCILFAESSLVSGDASGLISHRYGSGVPVTTPVSYNNALSDSVFAGDASGKLADGSGVSCNVTNGATRYVDVYSAVLDVTATITLGSTPYARFAKNADALNGKLDTDFILASSLSGGTPGQVLSRSGTNGFTWITPFSGGSSVSSIDLGSASATGTLASARLPDVASSGTYLKVMVDSKGRVTSGATSLTAADIPNHDISKLSSGVLPVNRGGTGMGTFGTSNSLLAVNNEGSGLEYKAIAGGSGILVNRGPGAININLDLVSGHVTTALGYTPAKLTGDTFTGVINFTQNVAIGHTNPVTRLDVSGTIKVGNGNEPCSSGLIGAFRYGSGTMEFCNGTSWQALAISGVGVAPVGSAGGDLSGTYPSPTIANSAVTSGKILDGTILNSDIANSTITFNKLFLNDNDIPQSKINGLGASFTTKENVVSPGTISQFYRGDKTWQTLNTSAVPEGSNLYYTDTRVRAVSLAGLTSTDSTVVAADNILQAIGKLQGQISARWQTSGSDLFYNNGNVTIGSNSVSYPGTKLFVKNPGGTSSPVAIFESWDTNLVSSTPGVLTISRRLPSGQSPQNGFGSSFVFMAEDSAKALQGQAMIAANWVNANAVSSTSGLFFAIKDAVGGMVPKLFMDSTGVYVSGNLAASGSVKIGSDGSNSNKTCTLSEEGKQRYNSLHKAMEFCDGASWRGVNGVTYCDSGYSLVGKPGTRSALCIDTNLQAAQNYEMASSLCNSRTPTNGTKAKVCSLQQLDFTCENFSGASPGLFNFSNNSDHWTSNGIPTGGGTSSPPRNIFISYNSGGTTCLVKPSVAISPYNGRVSDSTSLSTPLSYRCCYE